MRLITQRGKPKEYKRDTGKEYFSISQVRNEMYNPYRKASASNMEAGRIRGNALHLRFALALAAKVGMCPYPDVIPQYAGWCCGMDRWIAGTDFEPIYIEQPSVWEVQGLAGTPENKLKLKGGVLAIVDLKTGGKTPTDGVQLMLNQKLEGYEDVTQLMDLYISEDGKPDPVQQEYNPFDFAAALNALQLLKWRLTI